MKLNEWKNEAWEKIKVPEMYGKAKNTGVDM
jgi:hypothetical protein